MRLTDDEFWVYQEIQDWKLKFIVFWYRCASCGNWFRFTRMWMRKEYCRLGSAWLGKICTDCAGKDKKKAMRLYTKSRMGTV
jgi:hypothetical protein